MNKFDSTEYRKQIWNSEYSSRKSLPSSNTNIPSKALRNFFEEFGHTVNKERALDLGSGNGRNSIFLYEMGFKNVVGIELSAVAVTEANQKLKTKEQKHNIKFLNDEIGKEFVFKNNSFDLVIDMMVMHSLTKSQRMIMQKEVSRVIKSGGYFVFYTIAAESRAAQELIKAQKGPEENSYRFEYNNVTITEKAFSKDELVSMFPEFKLIKLEPITQFTPAFGDIYERMYYYGVMQKI